MSAWIDFRRAVKAPGNGLDATARSVALAMSDYAGEQGVCWASATRIAQDLAVEERTVRRAWQRLHESGWIVRGPRAANRKTITWKLGRGAFSLTPDTESDLSPVTPDTESDLREAGRTLTPVTPDFVSDKYKEDKETSPDTKSGEVTIDVIDVDRMRTDVNAMFAGVSR